MATPMLILFIIHMILSFPLLSFSTPPYSLTKGSSLSVEKPDDVDPPYYSYDPVIPIAILLFDYDNILRLVFDGPKVTSIYWPDPWKNSWEALRSSFTNNRTATFNSSGHFKSNDDFQFRAADFGTGIQKTLTMGHDGNIRLYSLEERSKTWTVVASSS
ncbi:hypothetical protein ACSBR2_000588 [Camellia fascicularis]